MLSDFAALILAFLTATIATEAIQTTYYGRAPGEFYSHLLADRLTIVSVLSFFIMGWFAHKRHYTGRRGFWTEAKHILLVIAAVALLDGWLHFALKMQASRLWQVQLWLYAATFILSARILARQALRALGAWERSTLLIGHSDALTELRAFTSKERYLGYHILAAVDFGHAEDKLLARIEDRLLHQPNLTHALVACDGLPLGLLGRVVEVLNRSQIMYGLIPPLRGMPLVGLELDQFIGYDFIVLQSHRPALERTGTQLAKRCFDVFAASLLLLVLAPLLVVISGLLRLEGGPAFYASRRRGYGGRVFSALKFRTMRSDAELVLRELLARDPAVRSEWLASYKLKNDPRITRLGRFLRRTSLDELPQLINVLCGEMSLVGPRPLLLDEVPPYERWLHLYEKVRPGITGMWQVSGRDDVDYWRRVQLNNWYIRNWCLWHDLVILIKTVGVVIRGGGAS